MTAFWEHFKPTTAHSSTVNVDEGTLQNKTRHIGTKTKRNKTRTKQSNAKKKTHLCICNMYVINNILS